MASALRASIALARWLAPWAKGAPRGVTREPIVLDAARAYRAYVYRGARADGAYLVAPGLHYLGPDDPRLDRFCRVLASAGFVVLAPALPDHLALRIAPRATDDLAVAFDALEARTRMKPAVFSISFGSLPAIELCARAAYCDRVRTLVVFGGYADFRAAVRFAVTGEAEGVIAGPYDPLNAPVVYIALLPYLGAHDATALEQAWREMVERTWGRAEMKADGARDAVAQEIARTLDARDRDLFLLGCGLRSDRARIDRAILAASSSFAFADPRPHLLQVRAPVVILHGRDDDVIPWTESEKLARALPAGHPHRVLVTGLYDHTGAKLPSPRALAREAATMARVAYAMAAAPLDVATASDDRRDA
jgi:pimeloyl-ACP methyl ester carboxylesterase